MPNSNTNGHHHSYSVLLVENNPDDADLFMRALQKAQLALDVEIKAQVITQGSQASTKLKQQKFDVVFLDIGMPSPNGIDLTIQIRASLINRTTPIVIITGAEDRGLMAQAFQAGANWFLFKPVDRTRLLRLIETSRAPIDNQRRRLLRVKVKCKVLMESDSARLEGETLDLSLNGMAVHSTRVFPVGSTLKLSLSLPAPRAMPVLTSARVARVIGSDVMGLELENVSDGTRERLEEFLLPLIVAVMEGKEASK